MPSQIALVGIGKIARDQHIPSISANPDFELAATASRNAGVDGIDGFSDLGALLDARPDIPCVSLCTPPQYRYDDARAAIQAGRHVMLEKPPGATLSEVHDLMARAKDKGVTLFATWHSREAAAVDAARDWLAARRLTNLKIDWKEDVRHWHPGQDWIWEPGGLGVFDPGINALSVMTKIMPHAVHLDSAHLHFPENRATPVAANLSFRDPTGALVEAAFDWLETGDPKWNIQIDTDDGSAFLSEGGARFEAQGQVTKGENLEYPRLYQRFAQLVQTSEMDVDLSPMRHVADAFTLGKRETAPAFHW